MLRKSYDRFCFYWFGLFEGLVLTLLPSAIFFMRPDLIPQWHKDQFLPPLGTFFARVASLEALVIGGVLIVMASMVKDLEVHKGLLSVILFGDVLYLYTIVNYSRHGLMTLYTDISVAFGITLLLALVRCYVIYLLVAKKITD